MQSPERLAKLSENLKILQKSWKPIILCENGYSEKDDLKYSLVQNNGKQHRDKFLIYLVFTLFIYFLLI